MAVNPRQQAILRVVDEMLRRIQRWLSNSHEGPILPQEIGLAIQSAQQVCDSGPIPACCRDLAMIAVPRLAEELRGYRDRDHGKVRMENGGPGPSFWAAAKAVATARAASSSPEFEPLEPVGALLQQNVTHDQIARHIYGHRGRGPFVQPNGLPDAALIEQEAREPGSVIPSTWVPPWHEQALKRHRLQLQAQLQTFDRQQVATNYDDPATVEELLRDGAFVQQIERAKGVTRDEVLEAARQIGVTPIDGPGFHPTPRDSAAFEPDDDDPIADAVADRQALRALVIEHYTQSGGTRGASDIARELRRLGHDINTNSVSAMIGHWKRKNTSSNPAGA